MIAPHHTEAREQADSAIAGLDFTAGDATARLLGFTSRYYIEGGCMDGDFLVRPDTDLDSRFKAWGIDWQEWTWVNGWNVLTERVAA